jgi:hypothetical protein
MNLGNYSEVLTGIVVWTHRYLQKGPGGFKKSGAEPEIRFSPIFKVYRVKKGSY